MVSDSAWHQRLAEIGNEHNGGNGTYWLHPFENYQTNCPYLVGSYEDVAEQLAQYVAHGYRTFILDIPSSERNSSTPMPCFRPRRERQACDRAAAGLADGPSAAASRSHGYRLSRSSCELRALDHASNRLARALQAAGCTRGDRVGLFLPKSPQALIAMLGVLKADCIYVPIDTASPAVRIARILRTCECRCLIAAQSTATHWWNWRLKASCRA